MKNKLFLFSIIGLAFLLRVMGTKYGYPFAIGHFDEVFSIRQAVSFGATKSLRPLILMWPAFHSYVLLIFYGLYYIIGKLFLLFKTPADFAFLYLTRPFNFYFLARILSVIFGTSTVIMTYSIAKKIYNLRVGLLSAWLLAMSVTHITYSHWAKPDVFMVFLTTVSLLFSCLILVDRRLRNYLLAGFFAGLAMSAKYNAVLIVASLFVVHLLVREKQNLLKYIFDKKLFGYFLMLIIGFFIGSPYCLLAPQFFYREAVCVLDMLHFGEAGNINTAPWLWIITHLLKNEFVVGLIFLIGIIYCLCKSRKTHWIFLPFALTFILLVGKSSKASLHYLLPIFPAMSILGAIFLDRVFSFLSEKNKIAYVTVFLLFLILTPIKVFQHEGSLLNKDSRIIAKDWIEQNIPADSKIALFTLRYRDLPPLVSYRGEFSSVDYGPKARSIYQDKGLMNLLDKYYSDVKTYRIYKLEKEIPNEEVDILLSAMGLRNNYYLKSCYKQGWRSLDEIKSHGIEYLILSSFLYKLYDGTLPVMTHPLHILSKRNKEYFDDLMNSKELRLIKEVESQGSLGPTIKIYQIIY